MEHILNRVQEWTALYGLKIIAAAAILIIGRLIAGAIRSFVKRMLEKSSLDETLISFIVSVTYALVITFVIIATLGQLGVETASFIAVLGTAGLAVGLALQGSLSNFAAGVLLIVFKPFKAGDYIEGGGAEGFVKKLSLFTTEIRTTDNKKIIIPNSKLSGDNIVNYTAEKTRRIDLVAGVGYSDDLDKVKKTLTGILADEPGVLKEPAPSVTVLELADSSINFAVRPWVKTEDYWKTFFALQEKIKKNFDAEGISIPFPQQDVHLYRED